MANIIKLKDKNGTLKEYQDVTTIRVPDATGNYVLFKRQVTNESYSDTGCYFLNLDGSVQYTYTKEDIANMTVLPENNDTREFLVGDGWGVSLADLQTMMANDDRLLIMGKYKLVDGGSRVNIEIPDTNFEFIMRFGINGNGTIDWGDGSAVNSINGVNSNAMAEFSHTYAKIGNYTITIQIEEDGVCEIQTSTSGLQYSTFVNETRCLDSVYLDSHFTKIGQYAMARLQTLRFAHCEGVVAMSNNAFSGCYALEAVSFPNVTSVGSNAFYQCYALESGSFPNVTSIGTYAFYYCYALESVSFPNATSVGSTAFYYCTALESVSFPNVTSVGGSAFNGCNALEAVSFPNATSIDNYAFSGCYALESVSFPNVTSVGSNAFYQCYALESGSFPNVTSIGTYAFQYCTALESASFPNATSVGNSAFQYCYALKSVHLPKVTNMNSSSIFTNCPSLRLLDLSDRTNTSVPSISTSAYRKENWKNGAVNTSGVEHYSFYVVVPDSMVSAFQSSTNWQNLYADGKIIGKTQYLEMGGVLNA